MKSKGMVSLKLINVVKSRERAPLEFETHITEHDGDIMSIAKKEVVTVPQSATIKESAEIMVKNKFRRLPITDPGTGKLRGIVTAMDILDFLGGGDKYQILEKKHDGNFLSAINDPVREIMTTDVEVLSHKSSIGNAVSKMLEKEVGAFPIIDSDEKIVGIISEGDFAFLLSGVLTDEEIEHWLEDINKRYDKRIELYKNGVKQWDTNVSIIMVVRGVK
jgi:CBS domain-containing protein